MGDRGSASSFEVWLKKVGGKWTALTDDGTIKLFPDIKEARRAAVAFVSDGTVVSSHVFERILRESINCGGIHAAKLGINKPNVHVDGLQIGPKPPPAFVQKAMEKE